MSRPGSRLRCCAGVLLLLTCLCAFGQFEDPETTLARGDTALGQGRFDIAQSIYQGVLNANPNLRLSPWRCRNIAEANIRATHPNLKLGADWLQRAVNLAPDNISSRERLGEVLLEIGATEEAAKQYRFLLGKSPDNPQYVLGLASALRDSGQYEEGTSLLSAALQNQPDNPDLRVEYARNLLYQRRYDAARDQYKQVLHWYPNDVDARIGMAKAYSWQGNQALALEQYQNALVADPGNYDALVGQGFSLIWSGRQAEALPMLERANSRHPEIAEVRDALKRLGAANIFTGDVSAGGPEWPILAPTMKKAPDAKRDKTATAWNAPSPEASEPAASATTGKTASEPPPPSGPQQGHSMLWVVGMGLTVLVAVFVVAAFFLFYLPTTRNKKSGKTAIAARLAEAKPESNPVEQWARLEEFSRTPRVERPPKSYRPVTPPTKQAPLPLSELLPPPTPKPEIEPEPGPAIHLQMENTASEPARSSLETHTDATPSRADEPSEPTPRIEAPRPPRRRRGTTPTEKPWWRDLSNPDVTKSAGEPEIANAAATPPEVPMRPSPFLDVPEDVMMPSNAPNPLTPASERPSPPEEPPPTRPFTQVLSRALERAGDGQAEETPEPIKPEEMEEPEYRASGNGSSRGRAALSPVAFEPSHAISHGLNDASVVIVGCGVMVSHYRSILKSAGADVRAFTFWDLAMSSMRKRRADVLLIDGDALDGLTPAQMYTSAQVERYMFGSVLVGISSDEDRSALPNDVVLSHSLDDDELRQRFAESLQAS